uniref:Uncharacterized protein n=1 Tax=Dunaliella tertiolecta TaxID=3047 RepID=A0A7S3QXQ4_DUNTE
MALREGSQQDWESPISWEQARAYIQENTVESLGRMNRNNEGRAVYRAAMADIKTRYATTQDYLYENVFGLQTIPDAEGRRVAVLPAEFSDSNSSSVIKVWRKNDFPYNYKEGIFHFILWANKPLPPCEIEADIRARLPPEKPFLYWINPVQLQSVSGVSGGVAESAGPAPSLDLLNGAILTKSHKATD